MTYQISKKFTLTGTESITQIDLFSTKRSDSVTSKIKQPEATNTTSISRTFLKVRHSPRKIKPVFYISKLKAVPRNVKDEL